ncbi:probable amidase At4g34880 [Arachis hypogaea]|uniref:probable amidase At4g34880 n=1 Tax=Arachis hypogaea TaxID=3818 RepID=UPI000DECB9BA|nr:probable amidase At4g34880 [Arachis hypogaea]QHN99760.1 Putative amidase C869 [Arachis hypogaea]
MSMAAASSRSFSFFFSWLLLHTHVHVHAIFEFREATVNEIQSAFSRNEISSKQLVKLYKDEILRRNPILCGVADLNPDAESEAEKADQERAEGKGGTKLSGVPVLIKDNITFKKKRMSTTAGSYALAGSVAAEDAFVVKKLREAGAIIIGKATLKEWSGFRSSNMPGGWSAYGGQAKNPYNLSNEVCGSSSGSAISVAANFATVSLGTETDGSIICPSSYNSVVGIKPTVNLTSRSAVVPISLRQDSVGPIARTVEDAVYVLDVIVGKDEKDEGTVNASTHIPEGGYAQYLNPHGLQGKRLGILRYPNSFNSIFPQNSMENATYQQLFQVMREKGATLVDDIVIEKNEEIYENEMIALLAELKRDLNSYLENLVSSPVRSLADLITFNHQHNTLEKIVDYPQDMFIKANMNNGMSKEVQEAISNLERLSKDGFEKMMKEKNLDALIYVGQKLVPFLAVGGYPAITVPGGYNNENMALGVSFGGLKYSEPTLIEIAYSFEQATKKRRPPPNDLIVTQVTQTSISSL